MYRTITLCQSSDRLESDIYMFVEVDVVQAEKALEAIAQVQSLLDGNPRVRGMSIRNPQEREAGDSYSSLIVGTETKALGRVSLAEEDEEILRWISMNDERSELLLFGEAVSAASCPEPKNPVHVRDTMLHALSCGEMYYSTQPSVHSWSGRAESGSISEDVLREIISSCP